MFCPKCGTQNPDGAMFCTNCGEKIGIAPQSVVEQAENVAAAVNEQAAEVKEEVAAAVTEAAAPVAETVNEAFANAAPVIPEAPVQQPVFEQAPVQQPVFEQAPVQQPVFEQPVYQQPVYQQAPVQQPVYQQPVYQQPQYQQPVYQQPVYQQPEAPKKKKSKAPLIIGLIIAILVLAAGGLAAWANLTDDHPDFLNFADFTKEKSSLALSEKEQKTFTSIVKKLDQAIIDNDSDAYEDEIPSYARKFVWSVYDFDNADDFVEYLYADEKYGVKQLGDEVKVTEEIVSATKVKDKDLDALTDAFEKEFNKSIDIASAYLIGNNSCFKGEKSEKYFDYYLFFKADDDWHVILIGKDNLETFGLKEK